MKRIGWLGLAALCAGTVGVMAEEPAAQVLKIPPGYIASQDVPDSAALIPPPPPSKSAAEKRDKASSKTALAAHGTVRWVIATSDADLFTAKATGALSCAAGFEISPQSTPALDKLLRRSMVDFGLATSKAKKLYNRDRPFELNRRPMCTPDQTKMLEGDGAYPSGHSAIGFGWGMLLSQLLPDRTTELMTRGREFGESRRFCNVHWQSDVEEGRVIAAAVFARLQSQPSFLADLQDARAELMHLRRLEPTRDCALEARALSRKMR